MVKNVILSNEQFSVAINIVGAELKSVKHINGTEFMWQADKEVWPRCAPVLFPVVGRLKNDLLWLNNQSYPLGQHGFARDMEFEIFSQHQTGATLRLVHNETTIEKYPFEFDLRLSYELENNKVICSYQVFNPANVLLPFTIGAHPGFNTPENNLNAYVLEFEQAETQERHLLSNGLFNGETAPVLQNTNLLPLSTDLFEKDAIVFKYLNSKWVKLKHLKSNYAVKMIFEGFPYFGIWTKKFCEQYVCLEPWFGYADKVEGHEDFYSRVGMILLKSKTTFNATYTLEFTI